MRILHISTRLILGGSQENTVLSCEGQATKGHDVHLAFGPIFGPEGSMLERVNAFSTPDGQKITTHDLPHMVRELSPIKDWFAGRECRKLIRKIQPDIVHTHSSKAGIIGRAAAWKEGGKQGKRAVIHTIHGLPFHPYEKWWRNKIYIASERFAAKRCHHIATVCNAMAIQAIKAGVSNDTSLFSTIYSGMEVDAFLNPTTTPAEMRSKLNINKEDFVIGTIARLAELKGHDDLLDALADSLHDNPNWKLLWVGDGWWKDRLMQKISDLGLKGRIITTGLVPPTEIPDLLQAMDILIHPSYREGLPRTVPQALLTATPTIVYNVDGAPEVCIEGETGVLVKPGNLDQLRNAVHWMNDNPQKRIAMGQRGRELCKERFATEKMVNDLLTLYKTILTKIKI